jgi:hypothetical protein
VTRAVAVDASSAYIGAARQEAERIGRAAAVEFVHADFLSVASQLSAATLVTLDRVVCCYPSYEPLLAAALRHADQCLAVSYPRDVWYVRLAVRLENGQRRLAGNSFRTLVHPVARMEQMIREAGFELPADARRGCGPSTSTGGTRARLHTFLTRHSHNRDHPRYQRCILRI